MKIHRKVLLITFLFMLVGINAIAQKFTTHSVKAGETLESIAKRYHVSEQGILNYNKEIKKGQALRANTILVIPSSTAVVVKKDSVPEVGTLLQALQGDTSGTQEREPIGYTSHRAKRKETLFGISRQYNISEDDIKRYNTELYSAQLKKGMILKIPKYKRIDPSQKTYIEDNYEIYTVQPKETRWSIANKYGITIDSLLALNPKLSKITDYLSLGQELLLPKILGSSIQDQETQLYNSYTVPAKQTFYSLEKKFGLTANEIIAMNPEIKERGGLKEGMVLRISVKKMETGEVNIENYNFYEVKPKQTEFSLTRKFGVTYKELLELNPELKDGLKAGMVLKLPKAQKGNFDVKNALILDKINLRDSINTLNRPKLVFLLPFRLDRLDLNDNTSAKSAIENRKDVKYSLGLYSGAMVALDSVAKLGISVDVKTYDTQLDLNRTKGILQRENLIGVSAIFGPLEAQSLKEVALQASEYGVPVIAPLTDRSDLSLNNVFFALPSEKVLEEHMLDYVEELRTKENVIIIADQKNKPVESTLLMKFPGAKIVALKEDRTVDIAKISKLLSKETENWVFLETDQANVVYHVGSLLNSLISKEVGIRLFTTDKNKAFDSEVVSYSHLSNLKFTFPSASREIGENGFVKLYRAKYGADPDEYAVRGFDLTYDLLLKLAYKNNLVNASKLVGETEYVGNKFNFNKDISSGYYNRASYILGYENMNIIELKD
ncbi:MULTISPECIES: LysM peptidoglycan-binding domain-containing protein [unclassified Arenibacter]|uniref:LysM peptidoglycan-binding domain-containing protein n=1 Tax=unclassified Arenibacter TaxID=2615047 RepID=UPI000E340C56|nr:MULTISPECIES: LysM peptidoglycan-binding domain-containing protein [unclassified Arenibacter]MCM4165240.1 peptidoglycan-binding protein LysM [Arenibacter sp. A80]RFT55095.1 LysM peptidoglycan-binding domain-containing protein [Arenibacter sp. P308M17]